MKTLFAALIVVLAVDASFAEKVRAFLGHVVSGPPKQVAAPAPNISADSDFAGSHAVGDTVHWVVDIQTAAGVPPTEYLLVVMAPSNLSASVPAPNCPAKPCPLITVDPGGAPNEVQLVRIPGGARVTINGQGTILAPGAFSVPIATVSTPNGDASKPTVALTLVGQAAAPTTNPATNSPPAPRVLVTRALTPPAPYGAGATVTAIFTFHNVGDAPQAVEVLEDSHRNLQVTGYGGDCPAMPCGVSLGPGQSFTATVDAKVLAPSAGASNTFLEAISYQIGEAPGSREVAAAIAPQALNGQSTNGPNGQPQDGQPLTWVAIAAAVLVIGAAAVGVVNSLRRAWWDKRIGVRVSPNVSRAAVRTSPIPEAAPTVRIATRIEQGAAAPRGDIPVTGTSIGRTAHG